MSACADIDRAEYGRCVVTVLAPRWVGAENILLRPNIQGDYMYPPMTTEGLGVLGVDATYTLALLSATLQSSS